MNARTRIKICGITRSEDLQAAIGAGADALGFVFYPPSQRFVNPDAAARLCCEVPPFVTRVGLFVNADPAAVRETLATASLDLLQFHGDEDAAYCRQFGKPYIKAARVRPGLDLVEFGRSFATAGGILLDAYVEGYGGAGQTFDWSLIPRQLPRPMVLSGGLTPANVGEAIVRLRPWAVDVSSGVELAKGIKDADKIAAFVAAVKEADAQTDA
ncbi:MAG: phosphoribosylanthranilate isomerase [Gammaproteobacteria bacterium]|nr:phosphoribosylanthranilate isomerase [Gammaproteobacteria bacterium]MBU1646374.1 phosphoribosylanthranilate isomerase [Gammaproteobacteria bacterium]MBU1970917.1 phosphoribosylanthranilate isomerase [Gammaproteobacteria bacterium]